MWLKKVWDNMNEGLQQKVNLDQEIDMGDGKKITLRAVFDRLFYNVQGKKPLGTTPIPQYEGKILAETMDDHINPILKSIQEQYLKKMQGYRDIAVEGIPEHLKPDLDNWIQSQKGNMASAKAASSAYGEHLRDDSLLNYTKQTGGDEAANIFLPYQFWYTRTMMNWARRVLEKPSLFAMYYRLKKAQDKMQADGMPARFYGKMAVPAPYLPDWMGGGLYIDPLKQIFPFSQFLEPGNQVARSENNMKYATFRVLADLVKERTITPEQSEQARESMAGAVWDQAYAIALKENDLGDPMTLASMMMTPGMYLTIPYYMAQGKPEKISPTPAMRTALSMKGALAGSVAEPLGNIIGALAQPEIKLRESMGLTPGKAMFGEFGDYYIERNIANLVGSGDISIEDGLKGIQLHEGQAYNAGLQATLQEVALKTPGLLPLIAIKNGATIPDVAFSILMSLYPAGLLPEGELKYLKNKPEYAEAWNEYKLGYKGKLSEFFDKHPEYEARIALKSRPEEKLRQYLVSEIWDKYYDLEKLNKNAASKELGQLFQDRFLASETRNYEGISLETLARWSYMLGGYMPQEAEELSGVRSQVNTGELRPADMWSPEVAAAYSQYQAERDRLYPNYYSIQNQYYALPKGKRSAFLKQFPELKKYWEWKASYAKKHPEIQGALASASAEASYESATQPEISNEVMRNMQPELITQLSAYFMTGENLTPGAWMALQRLWENQGRPFGDLQSWIDMQIQPSFTR
jgi:hypothetical protein